MITRAGCIEDREGRHGRYSSDTIGKIELAVFLEKNAHAADVVHGKGRMKREFLLDLKGTHYSIRVGIMGIGGNARKLRGEQAEGLETPELLFIECWVDGY